MLSLCWLLTIDSHDITLTHNKTSSGALRGNNLKNFFCFYFKVLSTFRDRAEQMKKLVMHAQTSFFFNYFTVL